MFSFFFLSCHPYPRAVTMLRKTPLRWILHPPYTSSILFAAITPYEESCRRPIMGDGRRFEPETPLVFIRISAICSSTTFRFYLFIFFKSIHASFNYYDLNHTKTFPMQVWSTDKIKDKNNHRKKKKFKNLFHCNLD